MLKFARFDLIAKWKFEFGPFYIQVSGCVISIRFCTILNLSSKVLQVMHFPTCKWKSNICFVCNSSCWCYQHAFKKGRKALILWKCIVYWEILNIISVVIARLWSKFSKLKQFLYRSAKLLRVLMFLSCLFFVCLHLLLCLHGQCSFGRK